jgi:beta-lactamase class D
MNMSGKRALLAAALVFLGACTSHAGVSVEELPLAREVIDASGFSGAIVIHDADRQAYAAGHSERADRRLIPASTFKIFSSLVALETGVVADAHTIIPWDGVPRSRVELNQDLDLQAAFRISAVPHYQVLVRRIGAERMQQFIDAVGYGNRDISGGIDQFWLTGGLRISPREQVDFLARLYRGDLPFSAAAQATVREMMASERTAACSLHTKTGWAVLPEAGHVGWWVGWVTGAAGTRFFATVLEAASPGESFGPARLAVTRSVLEQLGMLPPRR